MEACEVEKKGQKRVYRLVSLYYEAIQQAYPEKEIWLVEDNAPLHRKAAEVCETDRRERRILKAL